jgi:hypothetical protein
MFPTEMSLSIFVYFTTLSASQKDLIKLTGRHLAESDHFLMEEIATITVYLYA